jgi:hypothetical protein
VGTLLNVISPSHQGGESFDNELTNDLGSSDTSNRRNVVKKRQNGRGKVNR